MRRREPPPTDRPGYPRRLVVHGDAPARPPGRVLRWAAWAAIVQASCMYGVWLVSRGHLPMVWMFGLALIPNAFLLVLSFNYWFRPRPPRPPLLVYEVLDDAVMVSAPRVALLDLRCPHAVETLCAGDLRALRFLFEGESPLVLVAPGGTKESREAPPFDDANHWLGRGEFSLGGTPAHQAAVGDALVTAVERNAEHNRLAALKRELAELEPEPQPGAFSLVVEDEPGDGRAYRGGRPRPGEPGFAAWLRRESQALAPGVRVTREYAWVEHEGRAAALPLGRIDVIDNHGVPTLRAPDEQGAPFDWPVPGDDWAVAVALSRA